MKVLKVLRCFAVFAALLCLQAGLAEELPPVYDRTYLEIDIGETITLNDDLEVTVTGYSLCSYDEFIEEKTNDTREDKSAEPEYILAVDLTIKNIGNETISGKEIVDGMSPLNFWYYTGIEFEQGAECAFWTPWDEIITAFVKAGRGYANPNTYGIYFDEGWPDPVLLEETTVKPGAEIEITDLRGSISPKSFQSYYMLLGYRISWQDETKEVMLQEFRIDFNDPNCFVEGLYGPDSLMNAVMHENPDVWDEYLNRCMGLNGNAHDREKTCVIQKFFGLEETGIFDQELLNQLVHYHIINE